LWWDLLKKGNIEKNYFILFLFLVIIISTSYILPVSSKEASYFPFSYNKGEYHKITDFNDFKKISENSDGVYSNITENQIYFENNNSMTSWASEAYYFNFEKYGNITDCEIYLTVNYYCNVSSDLGRFIAILNTNYSFTEDDYSNYREALCGISFENSLFSNYIEYKIESVSLNPRAFDYNENYPLQNTFKFHFKKEGDTILGEILNSENKSILTDKWNAYYNYVDASGLELFFLAGNNKNFSIEINSFNAKLEIENRNWKLLKIRDIIIYSIAGIIVGIAAILLLIYSIQKINIKLNTSKSKEQILLERDFGVWDEKISSEKVLIITHLKFDGKAKKDDKCGICKTSITHGKEVYQCHNCKRIFHKVHLIEWFKKSNTCPICKTELL